MVLSVLDFNASMSVGYQLAAGVIMVDNGLFNELTMVKFAGFVVSIWVVNIVNFT